MNGVKTVDVLYVSDKLVMAHLSHTFLIFYCYFTHLKARKICGQNMRNLENIGHTRNILLLHR